MTAHEQHTLKTIDLGRMAYLPALEVQRATHERVVAGEQNATLLLVEHDPVITLSQRRNASRHLLASSQRLQELGIDVQETDRGGDITYHGPGQLVAYPILPLQPMNMNVGRYMRWLEQVVIDTLATFGINATREAGATGVWTTPAAEKLCAMGIRVKRNVTMHGLALNVTTDLTHFDTIVPCGLTDRRVTSMARLLAGHTPTMDQVKSALIEIMQREYALACTKQSNQVSLRGEQ